MNTTPACEYLKALGDPYRGFGVAMIGVRVADGDGGRRVVLQPDVHEPAWRLDSAVDRSAVDRGVARHKADQASS